MKVNQFGGQEKLKRAYEIALTGNYLIKIFAPELTQEQINEYIQPIKECIADNDETPHLLIELQKPDFFDLVSRRKCETLEDVKKRAKEKRLNNDKPEIDISDASETLLKTAYERLNLMPHEIGIILNVAATIAQMDNSKKIDLQHVAEAIQYRSIDPELKNKQQCME